MNTFFLRGKLGRYADGVLTFDGKRIGSFKGLKEAKEHCASILLADDLSELLVDTTQPDPPTDARIALALTDAGEVRVTESMVECFKSMIEQKMFFPCDSLLALRLEEDLEYVDRVDYRMRDGSVIILDIETNSQLNKIESLKESAELIRYMTTDSPTFVQCVERLLEEH